MKTIFKILTFAVLCLPLSIADINAEETENTAIKAPAENEVKKEAPVKRRINWEEVNGAIEYKVQIMDSRGRILIDGATAESSYAVELPQGDYRIRIGAVNKFGKIGSWSDWANITLEEKEIKQEIQFKTAAAYKSMILKIGVGASYFQLLPDWGKVYDNSYNSTTILAGAAPLDFSYFRYAGVEMEGSFTRFKSKSGNRRIKTKMSDIITGLNLYFTSWFNFPVNLVFRLGGGIAFTEQEYEKFNPGNIYSRDMATLKSSDPYYKAGLCAEYRIAENLYVEAGADFYLIRYLTSDLKGLKYFVMVGTGL